jgi:outer membrane protein assembly factor BamB
MPTRLFFRDVLTALAVWTLAAGHAGAGENWPRFRGEDGAGQSDLQGLPSSFSPGDFEWNIELPGFGHGSPIIWEGTLFVTSALGDGDQPQQGGTLRYLFCLDAATGREKWSRMIGTSRSHRHLKGSWASSTPTTDGERVYVAFADLDNYLLTAYDLDGNIVWRRNLGPFESQHGQGVSPIIYKDLVILPNDQDGPSSIVAFDRRTGRTVWSVVRSIERASYATPLIIRHRGGPPQLICASGATGISSLDPDTGRLNWQTGQFGVPPQTRTVASPMYAGGLIFQSNGGGGKGFYMVAVDPDLSLGPDADRIRHIRDKALPYVPTPIVCGDYLFLWGDNGVVHCVDPVTGREVWTKRVPGNYSGSPVCVDGRLYIMSEAGDVVVIAAAPEFRELGRTPLGDPSHSTPAVAHGRLYLRTFHRLACLKASPAEARASQ